MITRTILLGLCVCVVTACSDSDNNSMSGPCEIDNASACPTGQVCEQVQGGEPQCFAPVVLQGRVYDLNTQDGIPGAFVLASDENGAPTGPAVLSDDDGTFELRVSSIRTDANGAFQSRKVMLTSRAKDYVAFPSGTRVALPIDTSAAAQGQEDGAHVLKTPQTDIGLSPVSPAERGLPSVSGAAEVIAGQKAVLVALESDSAGAGRTAPVSSDGAFTFFNVPAGAWKLSAYCRGTNYTAIDVAVQSDDVTDLSIKKATANTATLSGSVQIVGTGASGTSVVLALDSTFMETLGRGEVVPGLRAPEPGIAPNIKGHWTIDGIPDGKYVVLAAFENDELVRDPDPGISGTQIVRIVVSGGAVSGGISPSFKVTGAVGMVGPGRDGPEGTTGTPTFKWNSYSNADGYTVYLYDALGQEIWKKAISDKGTISATYDGAALALGQFFQWRVTALRKGAPTSMSEELRGVFFVE